MITRRSLSTALLAAVAVFGFTGKADAGLLQVTISQTGFGLSPITVIDNTPQDLSPMTNLIVTTNLVLVGGNFGSFTFTLIVDSVHPGTATLARVTLQAIGTRANTANLNPLVFDAFQDDFAFPGTSGATVNVESRISASEIELPVTNNVMAVNSIDGVNMGTQTVNAPSGSPPPLIFSHLRGPLYDLRSVSTINLANAGDFNYSTQILVNPGGEVVIPEPASVALLLGGMPVVLGCYWRQRRRKQAA